MHQEAMAAGALATAGPGGADTFQTTVRRVLYPLQNGRGSGYFQILKYRTRPIAGKARSHTLFSIQGDLCFFKNILDASLFRSDPVSKAQGSRIRVSGVAKRIP